MKFLKSLHFKFLVSILMILAPFVAYFYYNNNYAINVVREKVTESNGNVLKLYAENTDKILNETNGFLYKLGNDPHIALLNTYEADSDEHVLNKSLISSKLSTDISLYSIITTLFVYAAEKDDLIVETRGNYYQMTNEIREQLPKLMEQDGFTKEWIVLHTLSGSLLSKTYNIGGGMYAGAWIRIESLINTLAFWNTDSNGGAMIVSDQGKALLSSPNTSWLESMAPIIVSDKKSAPYSTYRLDGSNFLGLQVASEFAPIRYIVVLPEKFLLENLQVFQRTIYFIPLAGAAIIILYLFIYRKIIFDPIKNMVMAMRKVGQGNLDVRLKPPSSGELQFLTESFNMMISQIEGLKINVYEEQLRAKAADMKHLQVQINPHFYLNTLNVVYSLAELKEYSLIQKTVTHLVEYFRFIIKTNRTLVTVDEELTHIRNYLEIHQLRFPEMFSYAIDIPPDIRMVEIPPLVIQPFVENAIKHGMLMSMKDFRIWISAEIEQSRLIFTIRDNGQGFSTEMLLFLQTSQYLNETGEKHLGIWNVYHRLAMSYGDRAKLSFENDESGAVVSIDIPINEC